MVTAVPCYLFTYHGYGTWLPDQPDGYTTRARGKLPQDVQQASRYRALMEDEPSHFAEPQQLALIEELQVAADKQRFRLHFVATEPTHVHVLVSWKDDRPWLRMRTQIKRSLSMKLNREFSGRTWLSEGGSRKRVTNQEHFDYLVCTYLADHGGWKWCEEKKLHR